MITQNVTLYNNITHHNSTSQNDIKQHISFKNTQHITTK